MLWGTEGGKEESQAAGLSYSGMSELWSAPACKENQGKRSWCLQQEGCGLDIRGDHPDSEESHCLGEAVECSFMEAFLQRRDGFGD